MDKRQERIQTLELELSNQLMRKEDIIKLTARFIADLSKILTKEERDKLFKLVQDTDSE